jgi:acyl carrier protein
MMKADDTKSRRSVWSRPWTNSRAFRVQMGGTPDEEKVIEKVREHLAAAATNRPWQKRNPQCIQPQDRIVADLGIGNGPVDCLEGAAVIEALERDLGISIPESEAEAVCTVDDLVQLCARCRDRQSG